MGTESEQTLTGQRVAFTGRLVSMTRGVAVDLLRRAGAEHSGSVTSRTTMLVIGQDGWPLKSDGRVTHKLQAARRLRRTGREIEILNEEHFLDRLRIADADRSIRGSYSALDLNRLLGVRREQLRTWERAGLVEPIARDNGVPLYGYQDVSRLRSLMDLLESGASFRRVRRSLQQLRSWAPELETPDWLGRLQTDGPRLIVGTQDGHLCEPHGQRLFAFDDEPGDAGHATLAFPVDLFESAVRSEAAGDFAAAAEAYERLLEEEGSDADVLFNLGNVLYAAGEIAAAAERFRQAVELDAEFVEAWLNLGNVLAEGGQHAVAVAAFGRALESDPHFGDAHYGLADALDELGRHSEARRHWSLYLQSESEGDWADYARARLETSSA